MKLQIRRIVGQNRPRDPFGIALRGIIDQNPAMVDRARGPQPLNTDGPALFPWVWMYDVVEASTSTWLARVTCREPGDDAVLNVEAGTLTSAQRAAVTAALNRRTR